MDRHRLSYAQLEAFGYNNGVIILDDLCKACYSNSSLGAIGRSIKISDVEEHLDWDPRTFVKKYDSTEYYAYVTELSKTGTSSYYPVVLAVQEYTNIDGNKIAKGNGFTRNEQPTDNQGNPIYYTATSNGATDGGKRKAGSSVVVTQTHWHRVLAADDFKENGDIYYQIFSYSGKVSTSTGYWFASRYVCINGRFGKIDYGLETSGESAGCIRSRCYGSQQLYWTN